MPEKKYIEELGDWQGFRVGSVGRYDSEVPENRSEIWIELFPDKSRPMECSGCGEIAMRVHERVERWIRDLPAWGADTRLLVHLRRVKCIRCGTAMEKVPWLEPYARVTKRLAESIARLCDILPVRQAAEFYDVAWHTAKRIHKHYLIETLGAPDLSNIKVIGMDEFAIEKGHRYATVIIEPKTRRVLWVGRGRRREDIRPFFEMLGKEGCMRIEAAVMDMWKPIEQEVRTHCKQAEYVYDLFHVVANYGREVLDRVRVDEANRL